MVKVQEQGVDKTIEPVTLQDNPVIHELMLETSFSSDFIMEQLSAELG